jgi:hypothetical protein
MNPMCYGTPCTAPSEIAKQFPPPLRYVGINIKLFFFSFAGQARGVHGIHTNVPQYIIGKLGLNRDPLAELQQDLLSGLDPVNSGPVILESTASTTGNSSRKDSSEGDEVNPVNPLNPDAELRPNRASTPKLEADFLKVNILVHKMWLKLVKKTGKI